MSDAYFLPPHTSDLIEEYSSHCKNLGLILDKYLPQAVIKDSKNKGPWLKSLDQTLDTEMLLAVSQRWRTMLDKFNTTQFTAPLAWRMIVGLGGESVLETDMTLHHIYGIPFIPGSALKGLTRAYAACEDEKYLVVTDQSGGKHIPSPEVEKDHKTLQRVFGSQEQAGSVIFFDALPQNGHVSFVVDIINPHYPDYYNSLKSNPRPPTNDQSPNPITFLTVAETSFIFALAPRDASNKVHQEDAKLAQSWLKLALRNYGVGSKTSAGYGYFTVEQQQEATEPSPTTQKTAPSPYVRPNIPSFNAGLGIGSFLVIAPTDELRSRAPEAEAFLRYRELSTKLVLVVVEAEEAVTWTPGQTKNCVFVREEERDGCTILICQPGASKKKKG
jgi:CRISPR-associated protein Cmr6